MRIGVDVSRDLRKVMKATSDELERAVTQGIRETSPQVKEHLRAQVRNAGMGKRLANSWRGKAYPKAGVNSFNASALIWTKAPKIVDAFDKGVLIRGKKTFALAIPTDNAPKKGVDGKRISPSNFPVSRYGKLRLVRRTRGASLLVVDGVGIKAGGKVSRQRKNGGRLKNGAYGRGVATVPMFFIVRQVKLEKRFDVEEAERYGARVAVHNIIRNLRVRNGRK
ncbi:DUF6441 family protein [uncultured Thalassospira sp.]|uniref:DUF6441 family protein n=1 Tax=uncultured Thalassospira sp. TaxID=404382 RepID=UPI0030DA53A8|tara:strand:+ start:28360 stop:29028 length:669 start_codon:yes stop_codon:yes gene_type:complete